MIIQGQVGSLATSASLPAGQQAPARQGNLGDLIVSELHGRYYESTYRRAMYVAANPTGVTSTAVTSGTTTAIVGIAVSNPINSPVNCIINKVGYTITVAPAAIAPFFFGVGYNSGTNVTHTAALTVRSMFVGVGAAGYANADSSFTFPTAPNFTHTLGVSFTTASSQHMSLFDLEGSVILPPGGYAGIFGTVASGTSGFFGSISWEEVPV